MAGQVGLALGSIMIVLITIEDWLHVPQLAGWLSLGGLFLVFLLVAWLTDRIDTT